MRTRARAVMVLVLVLLGAGCVPWYEGTPASLYQLPNTPAKAPGTLERVQEWTDQSNATTSVYRVMYWTKDRLDLPVLATGIVRVPKAAPPAAGTTIAAWDHGTAGVASQCAPSRYEAGYPGAYLPANVPVAIPDYIGLGPVGEMHAWLAGVSEARSTIDLVRATKGLPNVKSNGSWYVAGHSQGGHAALWTGEEAATYAPEMQLEGVVAIAPGTELNEPVYAQNYMKPAAVMTAYGLALDYPQDIDLEAYLTPEAESKLSVLETGCLSDIINAYVGMPQLVDVDPWTNPRFVELLVENEPGWQRSNVPVLIVQGGGDWIVPAAYTEQYVDRACDAGTRVKYSLYPNADHGTIVGQAANEAQQWLATVASGGVPPTSC